MALVSSHCLITGFLMNTFFGIGGGSKVKVMGLTRGGAGGWLVLGLLSNYSTMGD